MQKFLVFLYTNNERSEREIKETTQRTVTSKRTKYPGINLPKEAKDLYSENYKILMKEIKDDTERYIMFLYGTNQYKNDSTTQSSEQIQCNLYQITNSIFHRTRTKKVYSLYANTKDSG